jgi:Flp pilus assembly protein TadD
MQRRAQPHHRRPKTSAGQCRRPLVWAPIAITLALGACSGITLRDDIARRPPSLRIAKAALASGAPELALRVADLKIAKNPNDVSALVARGDALYALDQPDQARTAYRAAIKVDPETPAAQLGLGRTLAQSDPGAAEAAFLSALSHDPDNVIALNNLGVVRDLQGRHEDAQEAYSHALSVAPTSADVQINLGMSLALSGRTAEASRLLHAVASDPEARQAWRKELINALTLAGDGGWAQQELLIDPVQPPLANTAVAESAGPTLKEASPPAVELAQGQYSPSWPGGRDGALPRSNASADEREAHVAPPSEIHQTLAIATDPRAPVLASKLPPIVTKVRDHSSDTPVASAPELEHAMSDAPRSAVASAETIAGPLERLDRFATSNVPRSEDAASPQSDAIESDFYVQLASLTSRAGAFFEWDRLKRRLPQFLADREPTVTRAEAHGRTYWRLRAFGFASLPGAEEMCRRLEQTNLHCWTGRGI